MRSNKEINKIAQTVAKMEKHKRIKALVRRVLQDFAYEDVTVKDHWEGDLCAIGFTEKTEQYLAYVSTWLREKDQYFVSLEYPSITEDLPYEQGEEFQRVSYSELTAIIRRHVVEKQEKKRSK